MSKQSWSCLQDDEHNLYSYINARLTSAYVRLTQFYCCLSIISIHRNCFEDGSQLQEDANLFTVFKGSVVDGCSCNTHNSEPVDTLML